MRSQVFFEIGQCADDGMELLSESGICCFSEDQIVKRDVGGIGDFNDRRDFDLPMLFFIRSELLLLLSECRE